MYGPLIIAYLFLGGTAAGGFFMMASWDLAFLRTTGIQPAKVAPTRSWRVKQAFESLRTRMYTLCLLLLILSMLFLFWDLGVPARALYIFLHPHATVLTFGAASLVAEVAIGGLLALGAVFGVRARYRRIRRALNVACCLVSLAVMAYTGAFLISNVGIAFWNTWTIVPLFVFSSLSCGASLMLLINYFTDDHALSFRTTRLFQKLHLAFLAGEAISLFLFMRAAFLNPVAANACEMVLSPDILSTAIIGVIGFGLVVPAVCEGIALAQRKGTDLPIADAFCLCGGFLLRFCIISCGVY